MNRKDGKGEPATKKIRGPYKRWLFDPSVPVPPSTIHSRQKAAANLNSVAMPQQDQHPHDRCHEEDPLHQPILQEPMVEGILGGDTVQQPHMDNIPEKEAATDTSTDYFIKKHHLRDKLHSRSSLSKLDVLLMILHLAVRHCNTQHFVEDLIMFVNCLWEETVLDISFYIYKTLFKPCVQIIKHFVCTECDEYLGRDEDFLKPQCPKCKFVCDSTSYNFVVCTNCNCYVGTLEDFEGSESVKCPECEQGISRSATVPESSALCPNCKFFMVSRKDFLKKIKVCECVKCHKQVDVKSATSGNYFISFSLREQIQEFLSRPGLKFVNRSNRQSVIGDICDGEFYQKLMEPGGPLSNENALTITFNTDGVEVHQSTKNSLWPIWFYINEIIPEHRFKQENLILAGLWFGKSAPNMSIFLQPFVNELVELSADGVTRILPSGLPVKCPVYPLTCSLDSVAKPKVVCQKQFNGKWGCLYCYHPNDTTVANVKNQRFYDQETTFNLRTDEEVIRDMYEADSLQQQGLLKSDSVNGFLGISVLLTFTNLLDFLPCNTFSLVFGVVIDYLHATLEGVCADLFNIITNLLTSEQLAVLNKRIEKITPPQAMTRRPRSFKHITYWRAKEYRAVLLYYILPCLEGLLAEKYYENLKLFVNSLHILLSDCITSAQLSEAASCLSRFCVGFQRIYGIVNVSYNLHLCRHLPELVTRYGALWCYSNFIFESGNGYLLNLVRGTKSVINEIALKHTAIQTASQFMMRNYVSSEASQFCSNIFKCRYLKKNDDGEKAPLVLSLSSGELSGDESLMLSERNVTLLDNNSVLYYPRIIEKGIVFSSKSYTKAKVYDDSCVMLNDGGFAVIDKIVRSASNELLCLIKPIRIAQGSDIIPSIKRCCCDVFETPKVIAFSDVLRKCFFLNVEGRGFVCQVPNFYERD